MAKAKRCGPNSSKRLPGSRKSQRPKGPERNGGSGKHQLTSAIEMRPRSPDFTASLSRSYAGIPRKLCPAAINRLALWPAATMAAVSLAETPTGFSTKQCKPAAAHFTARSWWLSGGVRICTASRFASAIISSTSVKGFASKPAANASAAPADISQTATRSMPCSALIVSACQVAMYPAPMMPTRTRAFAIILSHLYSIIAMSLLRRTRQ